MKFVFSGHIGYLIARLHNKLNITITKKMKPYGISPEQWAILNLLSEEEGISPSMISKILVMEKPNITRTMIKLEKKALVKTAPNPDDRRSYLIYITALGKELRNTTYTKVIAPFIDIFDQQILNNISQSEIEILKDLLKKIYNNIP